MPPADAIRHVGLNAIFLQPHMGGLETYVRELVPALLRLRPDLRLSIFVNELGKGVLKHEPWAHDVELITHRVLGRPYTRALTEMTFLGRLASRQGLDVLHNVAMLGPLRARPAQVTTIADVTWLRYPDPAEWITTLLWRTLVPQAAKRATRVLVFSAAARDDVAAGLRMQKDRIDVVPLGPGGSPGSPTPEAELRSRLGLEGAPVILSVAPLRAHKNVQSLVEALPAVRQQVPHVTLVLAGGLTGHSPGLLQRAAQLGVEDAIRMPGWVDNADLEGLYQLAACFAFPSLNEGFGLPILEAMRRSVPVVCSNVSSIPEVAGGAAEYFDPREPGEIAASLIRVISDPVFAASLVEKGLKQQAKFTWRRAAEETLAVYEKAKAGR